MLGGATTPRTTTSAGLLINHGNWQGGIFTAKALRKDCGVNLFRDRVASRADLLDEQGCVHPSEGSGLGIEVDEEFLAVPLG